MLQNLEIFSFIIWFGIAFLFMYVLIALGETTNNKQRQKGTKIVLVLFIILMVIFWVVHLIFMHMAN